MKKLNMTAIAAICREAQTMKSDTDQSKFVELLTECRFIESKVIKDVDTIQTIVRAVK